MRTVTAALLIASALCSGAVSAQSNAEISVTDFS